ncbi:hypothetical protein [Saccharopolyspora sp. 5N708]|uniref:hypothetical protein n=1 Tax=Saccharopolyspora sp. 5N708 TaxID=3457424 RepID=UPI003FD684B5
MTGEQPQRRWWQRLLSGPAFVITALVAALAGVVAPLVWNAARDVSRPPVLVWASSDGGRVGDLNFASPEVLSAADPATPYEFFEGTGRGTKAGVQGSTVTIEGARSRDIVITNMRARVLSREPNITGTLFCAGQQGDLPADLIGFDLDEPRPTARVLDGDRLGEPFFAAKAKQLADGETAVFQIESRATGGHYRWVLEIDMVIDGKPQTHDVQPTSGPFEITGLGSQYGAVFRWDGHGWAPGPSRSSC